jgi:uracil-DNA glycosylase
MVPLAALVRDIRAAAPEGASVPDIDPCDGGTNARLLFLLEAPGPKAIASGFVSRNNPDETARNTFELQADAGLDRSRVLLWNVVPWYIGDGRRVRAATAADVRAGAAWLERLVVLLPELRGIVLVGGAASRIAPERFARPVPVLRSPHPSPVALRTRKDTRDRILAVWRDAASMLA